MPRELPPPRHHGLAGQGFGLASEVGEDRLGDVPSQVGVGGGSPGRGPHQVQVPMHERGEGFLRAVFGIAAEQFLIGGGMHRVFGREHPPVEKSDRLG